MILFTHNDLDALGCLMVIAEKFKDYTIKIFHTNYSNIPDIVDDISNHFINKKPDLVVCADVSFSTSPLEFDRLYKLVTSNGVPMLYFDHHLYPDNFFDSYQSDKFRLFYDKSKCATKICYDTLFNDVFQKNNPMLSALVKIIDVYDIWQSKDPNFKSAQNLNNYFWEMIHNDLSIMDIYLSIKDAHTKGSLLPENYKPVVDTLNAEIDLHLMDIEKSNLVHRNIDYKTTLYFSNKHFNPFMINEHLNGQWFVVQFSSYGIIRMRISQDCDFTDEQFKKIMYEMTGQTDIGHKQAFTWKTSLDCNNNDKWAFIEAERICKILLTEF